MEYFDVGTSDLRELWESYLSEPVLGGDVLMATREEEWGNVLWLKDKSSIGVVLRDRLMTDAALGGPRPIKSEHSYSLSATSPPGSPPATPADIVRHSDPLSNVHDSGVTPNDRPISNSCDRSRHKPMDISTKIDEMEEEEYFPAISMSGNHSTIILKSREDDLAITDDQIDIKEEPVSQPESPSSGLSNRNPPCAMVSPQSLHFPRDAILRGSDSEEDEDEDEDYKNSMELEEYETVDEDTSSRQREQGLPPTPPSSASSDSEGTVSASCSPERRDSAHVQNLRGLLTPKIYVTGNHTTTTRQPINTPLISCQPKGSTGVLTLTEEEKRTLIAEGYPVPTKLPLTKQEEKSLKKVRRKIKNKISAQESRRKKKEYMDGLERRVTLLANENSSYKNKIVALEDSNRELIKELQRLQALIELP